MDIINLGIMAHVDAGKTTLTEQILCACGAVRSAGSVDKGTAKTDSMAVEKSRGISVRSAAATVEYGGKRINIIDTPGHIDFAGEAERALAVLDGAILIVSAVEGVDAYTEQLWEVLKRMSIPRAVFVNKIDRVGSNADDVMVQLRKRFGDGFVLLSDIEGEGSRECASYKKQDEDILPQLADVDDRALEMYLSERINGEEIVVILRECTAQCKTFPVICGASIQNVGTEQVLQAVTQLLPDASAKKTENLSAVVFKVESGTDMGKTAYVRLFGGELSARAELSALGVTRRGEKLDVAEKIAQIRSFKGVTLYDSGKAFAGEIAAICGASSMRAGDVIGEAVSSMYSEKAYALANPYLTVTVTPTDGSKLTELITALKELTEEEPLLNYRFDRLSREAQIDITGSVQLEIIDTLIRERYGIAPSFTPPTIIYKETPCQNGIGFDAYTMPKPCWACVQLFIEPLKRGAGFVYDGGKVPHNKLFYKYQEHIKQSLVTCLEQGLYGWEVTDLKVTLTDGEHHTIHTHPLDFFVATPMAFMNGLQNCETKLLEPLLKLRITAPSEFVSRVIGDITMMRGSFESPVMHGTDFTIEAIVPAATSMDYPVRLRAQTSGKAKFASSFYGYNDSPPDVRAVAKRRGPDPRERSKWILYARDAIQEKQI